MTVTGLRAAVELADTTPQPPVSFLRKRDRHYFLIESLRVAKNTFIDHIPFVAINSTTHAANVRLDTFGSVLSHFRQQRKPLRPVGGSMWVHCGEKTGPSAPLSICGLAAAELAPIVGAIKQISKSALLRRGQIGCTTAPELQERLFFKKNL